MISRSSCLLRIADLDHQHEAVELRFGQRVGALLLDRVLRRHDEERLGQPVGLLADGDLPLLHRLEQRRLHLGRRAVDLVGEHEVGEDRAALGAELLRRGVVDGGPDDVRGQKVGRELDALELGVQRIGHGLDRQRLGQAGHALEQHVAAGEQADEDALDHVALPDDDLLHLAEQPLGEGRLLLHQLVDDFDVIGHGWALSIAHLGKPRTKPPYTSRMTNKLLTLAFAALVAGCGSNSNNNGGQDMGGGGAGGCDPAAACTTAGATQCADVGDQQTCMQQNGCLQWVKSACSSAQICMDPGDGTGGKCVTGVPCVCPTGYSCDGSGVCVGGDGMAIGIDVKTVNVAGTVTLNGAAPTTLPSCNPSPATSKATRAPRRRRARLPVRSARALLGVDLQLVGRGLPRQLQGDRHRRQQLLEPADAGVRRQRRARGQPPTRRTSRSTSRPRRSAARSRSTAPRRRPPPACTQQRQRRQGDRAPRRHHRRLPLRSRRALLVVDVPVGRRGLPRHLRRQRRRRRRPTATCRPRPSWPTPRSQVSGSRQQPGARHQDRAAPPAPSRSTALAPTSTCPSQLDLLEGGRCT